jgi:PAS domain S-box-containing protein
LMGVLKGVREGGQALLTDVERDLWAMLLDVIALAVHNAQLYSTLASTTRFLEHLIQGAGDAIVTVDAADRVTLWNPAAERLFQAQAATMLGQPLATVLPRESYAACRAAVLTRGESATVETRLTPPGSTPRQVLLTLSPLQGSTEAGLSVIGKDVTAERQLREQQVQAEKWRAVGEMAAGIAHNFNNVLTTILTRAQLLMLPGAEAAGLQRGLTLIAQAATDGASIVRRLQKLARSGGPAEVNELDLNTLVQEVVETTQPVWQVQAQREGRPVGLELALTPLPRVAGRAAELREVLTNLLLNAVDAMPEGGHMTWRTWTTEGQVSVAVSDTGIGMSPEVQQRLFDPFYTTKGMRGTGLGLTVSQALIKGHQGVLTVDSTPGRGSTFTITLPGVDSDTASHTSQVVA